MISAAPHSNTGYYVEGRYFDANFTHARSFAFALANEYMRAIDVVWHNPSQAVPLRKLHTAYPAPADSTA